jgi:hypothetical protein
MTNFNFTMTSKKITIEYCGSCGFGLTVLAIKDTIEASFGDQFEISLSSSLRKTDIICIRIGDEGDGEIVWQNTRRET